MKSLALAVGLLLVAVGLVGLVAPGALESIGRQSVTPAGLYVVAAVRVAIGLVLLGASSASRTPGTMRVLGIVVLIAGLATPLIGSERANAILNRWLAAAPVVIRVGAVLAVAFGGFIIYAVSGSRQARR